MNEPLVKPAHSEVVSRFQMEGRLPG